MKFLGIELSGIAGYKKQFISIADGLNLIVGRNNIGKTAMLTAATVLRVLPVGGQANQIYPLDALEYSNSSNGFGVSIFFQADPSDAPQIDKRKTIWEVTLASQTVHFIYNFQVQRQGYVLLEGVKVRIGTLEYPIIRVNEGGNAYLRYWYDTSSGNYQDKQQFGTGGMLVEGGVATIYPQDDIFGHLIALKSVEFVSGHRVFKDFQELHTVIKLGGDAEKLGPYLQWLQGARPKQFNQIQAFITQLFPEFEYVNVESVSGNKVTIRFTRRYTEEKVQLSRCGTGVEQILALATFVISSAPGTLICVDEPHSFLHPTAERLLLEFLRKHAQHKYLLSTHSAIFINSVPANSITHLSGTDSGFDDRGSQKTSQLLFDLGYKNSDLLFADRIIFVEGETDRQVLPILLRKAGLDPDLLATAAFSRLKGSGDLHTVTRQSEELLTALRKEAIRRVYLFDGDKTPQKEYIQKIKNPHSGETIPIAFLMRTEIEDYLLDSHAIAKAISEEKDADQSKETQKIISSDQVNSWLAAAIKELGANAKGSAVLSYIYEQAGLRYRKTEHGRLIALHTEIGHNPKIKELYTPLVSVFPEWAAEREFV